MLQRFFILCCLFFSQTITAQKCFDKLNKLELYSDSKDQINGTKWIYQKLYLGTPLLMDKSWPNADITFLNGTVYKGVQMNWDLSNNELILFYSETGNEKYVVINKDSLSGFIFTDTITHSKHTYEYTELKGIKGKTLYENASVGKISFFIRPKKIVGVAPGSSNAGEYIPDNDYYLDTGNGYYSFHTNHQLIKLFTGYAADLKRFIRKNGIKITNQDPGPVIRILNYYKTLDPNG